MIWWNLVRLAEDTAELFGSLDPDDPTFATDGVQTEEEGAAIVARAEAIIESAGVEYRATFLAEYRRVMGLKLGLRDVQPTDMESLFSPLLELLEAVELDYHHFFRRLSHMPVLTGTPEQRLEWAGTFLQQDGAHGGLEKGVALEMITDWLQLYTDRLRTEDIPEEDRMLGMAAVNPNFVPRNWVLEEIIGRVEKGGDREVLGAVMEMVQRPFEDEWDGLGEDAQRWTGDVPRAKRATQCSCSS